MTNKENKRSKDYELLKDNDFIIYSPMHLLNLPVTQQMNVELHLTESYGMSLIIAFSLLRILTM